MDNLNHPAWFDHACHETVQPGIQLVGIEREANGEALMGRIHIDEGGKVWLDKADYLAWTGLNELPAQSKLIADNTWYLLSELPYRMDACAMKLQIAAKLSRRHYTDLEIASPKLLPNSLGGFINVDTFAFQVQNQPVRIASQADIGLSAFNGVWRTKHVFLREGSRRLDSQARWDMNSTQSALEIGDILNSGIGLSPDVRFGGISWGSDFSQRPEVPTYPLPSIRGEAALPSSAELYIDGQLRQSNRLSSGPYALDTQSGINGAGDIQVVVRDTLGRETRFSQPFYTSPKLLRAGLTDYRVDIGRLREGFATDLDAYTSGFLSARWRQGTESLGTWGARADIQHQRESLQGEWLISHDRWGLFQTGWGLSHDSELGWGQRGLAGYERLSSRGNFQIQASAASPAFIELGRAPGAIAKNLRAQTGWRLSPANSISIGWSDEQRRDRERIQLATATWNGSLNADRQLYLNFAHSPVFGLSSSLGLSQRINQQWLADAQVTQRDADGLGLQINFSWQPPTSAWSGRVASEIRANQHTNQANLLFLGNQGNISLGIGDRNGVTSAQTSASTTLAWTSNNLFLSKRIPTSFVVVDAGAPDVTVYTNNQPSGKTDAKGQLILTDVWPYQSTAIRLGWEDLPISKQLGEMESQIRPPRGVAHLRLASADPQHSEAWYARLSSGELLPSGSSLMRESEPAALPSGLEGLVYVPTQWRGSRLTVRLPDTRLCQIDSLPVMPSTRELTCLLVP